MRYSIEHRILTLSHNAVMNNKDSPASFDIESIKFSQWGFNYRDGWQQDFWLAKGEIEVPVAVDAINQFRKKLEMIIPRVALIGQSYTEFILEPWLLKKSGSDIALYRHIKDRPGVGLMFMEKEKKALDILLKNNDVPEAFYYYWNDAINSIGYSAKLLLMFSAIETLVKTVDKKKDWERVNKILGDELTQDLFGTKENPESGLRHRLVHGEYFSPGDSDKDYLSLVHKKVLSYFNAEVFKEELVELSIVRPQRHPFGNKEGGFVFIKQKSEVDLAEVQSTFGESGPGSTDRYEVIYPNNEFRANF